MAGFLKPSKLKILLTLVLFVILSFLSIIPCKVYPAVPNPIASSSMCSIETFYLSVGVGASDYLGLGNIGIYVSIVLFMVISYILSSFFVNLFNKK